ncbi:Uncharacterized protein TCAP_00943 [Tolypocladium capitatum]|uniref:Zn(2)-C6 fungal-type domain-containing protein n=1 Tax=Tolypocladium capitatum TaxID=45235 RepID=A0A2K3QNP2_9HYPO|nr:Uncharacterized protein TCAP_00943 [Tolypocladium capitatum]
MTLIGAHYIYSKPELWKSGCSNKFSIPSMPHRHIAPPPNETAMDMSQSAYNPGYNVASQDPSTADGDSRDSEGSYEEHNSDMGLRRSYSTPNTAQVQHQGTQETQSQSGAAGEKKRNKLGYHRTSIACSHCRRRKIRCIASPDVPNRCVNCIRLKKECSFYPVDQQPSADNRSRAPPRQTAGSSVGSATSSPAVASGSPGELPSHQPHAPVSGIAQGGKSQTAGDEYFPPDAKVPSNGMPAGGQYGYANQPPTNWMAADVNATHLSKAENLNMSWQSYPAESPMNTQFSTYAQSSTASATWASGASEAGSHDEMAWSDFAPPVRSTSYSGESTGSHQQVQYIPVGQGHPFERRPSNYSNMYPPQPFGAPVAAMTPCSGAGLETQRSPMAGTVASNAEAWQQQMLPHGQSPYAKQTDMFGGWQYDKVGGSQQMWLEQRPQRAATQAPSDAYYAT